MTKFTAIADNFVSGTDDLTVSAVSAANANTVKTKIEETLSENISLTPPTFYIFARLFKNGNFSEGESWQVTAIGSNSQEIADAYESECVSRLLAAYGNVTPDRVTIIIDIIIED